MQRIALESKIIKSAGYNIETEELEVEFINGSVGTYAKVPTEVWTRFLQAPSKGGFLIRQIKPHFAFHKE